MKATLKCGYKATLLQQTLELGTGDSYMMCQLTPTAPSLWLTMWRTMWIFFCRVNLTNISGLLFIMHFVLSTLETVQLIYRLILYVFV